VILSRLRKAIREQNWFAVALEVVIVVLGVVIGFQITAWGQARSDAAREQSYLQQIASDLATTETLLAQTDAQLARSDQAAERLHAGFRTAEVLPDDSVLVLISEAAYVNRVRPVLGTIQALIATGDLGLLRDDSLRVAIPAYMEQQLALIDVEDVVMASAWDALESISGLVDYTQANAVRVANGGVLDFPSPGVVALDSVTVGVNPFPFDAAQFRRDRTAYDAVWRVDHMKIQLRWIRGSMSQLAHDLNERVESALNQ
jgi:hypothetical protein